MTNEKIIKFLEGEISTYQFHADGDVGEGKKQYYLARVKNFEIILAAFQKLVANQKGLMADIEVLQKLTYLMKTKVEDK